MSSPPVSQTTPLRVTACLWPLHGAVGPNVRGHAPEVPTNRLGALARVGVLVMLAHCDGAKAASFHSVLEGVGVADAPVGAPLDIHVLCDPSEGSPCAPGLAAITVERVAREAFHHPRSDFTVYIQGERPADTRRLASLTVPFAVDRGERAARAAEERFVASVRAAVCPSLDAAITMRRPRQSPIVEALDEVALAKNTARPVVIVALTDLREVSALGDFECDRAIPSATTFVGRLRRRSLLQPGTLAGVRVHVVTGDHDAVPRRDCPVSMGRERELQALWGDVLRAAGASRVTFQSDVPRPETFTSLFTFNTPAVQAGATTGRPR